MPGHITLPSYQKEVFSNGMKLPATLSHELITNLLKNEMGFEGVVVTDALRMGGFLGWYKDMRTSQIESFKAGCDMMLWPTKGYVNDMVEAIENGYISMERLDDAVSRILNMKEKLGLFDKKQQYIELTKDEQSFVSDVQKKTAEASITLVRDKANIFPINPQKTKRVAVIPITHHDPAFKEAELLCDELRNKGFEVEYLKNGLPGSEVAEKEKIIDNFDLIIYALFSRSFRPMGFLDFHSDEAQKIAESLKYGIEKTIIASFGSPYFGEQYFERALTYVNAYSMLSPSVKAFVRAATGEIEFTDFSPVKLKTV
jgi:beta-N-acetylhexosaminidase